MGFLRSLHLAQQSLENALKSASKFSKRQRQKLLKTLTEIRLEVTRLTPTPTESLRQEESDHTTRKRKRETEGSATESEETPQTAASQRSLKFLSFGHKHGAPLGAWKLYDIRSVPNVDKGLRKNATGLQGSLDSALFAGKHGKKVRTTVGLHRPPCTHGVTA